MADISYKELEEYKELKQKKADYDLAKFIVKVGIGVVVFLMLKREEREAKSSET